jgi:hypothetical protein
MCILSRSLFVLGFVATVGWSVANPAQAVGNDDKDAVKEKKRLPKFTISKETTYVTGPLDKDGYIDYPAALNERLGKGIKPENNANVLIWKAIGPRPEGKPMQPEFYRLLGMEEPPERGDYFIDLRRYVKEHLKLEPGEQADAINNQITQVTKRPWTAKDYPEMAGWLKVNEKPLALAFEATRRSDYYNPLLPIRTVKGTGTLLGAPTPGVFKCRDIATALATRAMLHVGEGKLDKAWQDLLTCHRLGRLAARGATLFDMVVGIVIDQVASNADLALLECAKPTAKQATTWLRDLQELPPMPVVADKVDLGERFIFLDCVQLVQEGGLKNLDALAGGTSKPDPLREKGQQIVEEIIDWDPALRNGNRWYDRLAAATRIKDRVVREKELDRIDETLRTMTKDVVNPENVWQAVLKGEQLGKALGKLAGDILIALVMPGALKGRISADKAEQTERNLQLAFALAAYKSDHNRYPPKLDDLAPKYLARIPDDLFSGKALIYRPSDDGYLLYSVGVNGKDDGGRGRDDDPPGDDLSVRMPLPELKRK